MVTLTWMGGVPPLVSKVQLNETFFMSRSSSTSPDGFSFPGWLRFLIATATLVVMIAGLKAAQPMLAPFLLAVFLAIILFPPLTFLMKKGWSAPGALIILITSVVLIGFGVIAVVGYNVQDFAKQLPVHQEKLNSELSGIEDWFLSYFHIFQGSDAEEDAESESGDPSGKSGDMEPESPGGEFPKTPLVRPASSTDDDPADAGPVLEPDGIETESDVDAEEPSGDSTEDVSSESDEAATELEEVDREGPNVIDPDLVDDSPDFVLESFSGETDRVFSIGDSEWAMQMLNSVFRSIQAMLSQAFIILILVIFMLAEASALPAKLEAGLGKSDPWNDRVLKIAEDVRRYMVIKTWTSIVTGLLVTALLIVLKVDYPLLWGMIAFLFNFVPNIGSIIAAIPAVFLALLQSGIPTAAAVGAGYIAINCFVSYGLEPRFMGRGLGLSPLVVFLSLLLWGWVLGPVGMFLSAPLTMIVKIILESSEETRWIAILLGPRTEAKKAPPIVHAKKKRRLPQKRNNNKRH